MYLHAARDENLVSLHAVCAEAPAVPDGDGGAKVRSVVVPAAGADGVVPTRGGRTHRMSDPRRLAQQLNGQEVAARIDFDHQTEEVSKTFNGSTASAGWLSDFRAEASGAISAVLDLSSDAAGKLRRKAYRYLSPALLLAPRTGEIVAMSSLALVNNPNMPLDAPAVNSGDSSMDPENTDETLQQRADALKKREDALEARALNAATTAVDRAVEEDRLLPAQKEFALNAIKLHAAGVEAGIEAFEKAYPAETAEVDLSTMQRRTAPAGAPKGAAKPAAFTMPADSGGGYQVADESVQLHARVAEHAQKRGISYRDAVLELGALQR